MIWGVASLPLCEVLAAPSLWGEPQQLQLKGHRLDGMGATLEVQLFLSMVREQACHPMLCSTPCPLHACSGAAPQSFNTTYTETHTGRQNGTTHMARTTASYTSMATFAYLQLMLVLSS